MAKEKKPVKWPVDCIWPRPLNVNSIISYWSAEEAEDLPLNDEGEELLEIKEYYDSLVDDGVLDEHYRFIEDNPDIEEDWQPELGEDYWDNGFDYDVWKFDMEECLNSLKLLVESPVYEICQIIGYDFINENLLRQAFTRRSFAAEYGTGDSEKLEFLGDSIINIIVTREIARQLTDIHLNDTSGPFHSSYDEGDLSRIRSHFICKEYLSSCAEKLGLDKYILYGSADQAGESAKEDMIEALIGAVAVDCNWDYRTLEDVADKLLCIQLSDARTLLNRSFYDIFNSWHQKKFGRMPEYEVNRSSSGFPFKCVLHYSIPENNKGIDICQRVDAEGFTRSKARERAAEFAYRTVVNNGLWLNLENAGIVPDLDESINQLQELYQKKYVDKPEYSFEENSVRQWHCTCSCSDINGWATAQTKTQAKKEASFMVLSKLLAH